MEPNDTTQLPQFSSYFHHQQQQHHHHHQSSNPAAAAATAPSPTNGLLPPNNTNNNEDAGGGTHQMGVYPHSVTSTAVTSPPEAAKRKRGRPRKYGTPEQALAAKKAASSSYNSAENRTREESSLRSCGSGSSSYSSRKSQAFGSGNLGQGFTPHVITVAAGEDVTQKIMMFMQQSKREICILCASGSISNVSLRQPATSGGSITYEGRFEIISLSGSYIRTEIGGRTGGLSVCLSSSDGQIIGGGVGGPLKAAGPVQVIVGSFSMDTTKDVTASGSKLTSPVGGAPVSSLGFRSPVESSGRNLGRGGDDLQNMGGSHFMISPPPGMPVPSSRPMEWRSSGGYELTGRTGHGGHQSPENGDYDQIPD